MTTTTLEIVKYPNEILRKIATPIESNDKATLGVLNEMRKYVIDEENKAVGLALPQVGISKRGFIATLQGEVEVVINPKILKKTGLDYDTEGCLSVSDKSEAMIPRATNITVIYKNHQLKMKKRVLKGYSARIFLHEFDHLNGVLFMDYIEGE